MTPGVLIKTVEEIGACLRNSPVGAALVDGCLKEAIAAIIQNPQRNAEIIQTIATAYGGKGGWFSFWRVGGGLKAIIWVTPVLYREPGVRADVEDVQRLMGGVQHLGGVQRRVLEELKMRAWLAAKGWPLKDSARAKSA